MPFDAAPMKIDYSTFTTAEKLRALAGIVERVPPETLYMGYYHSDCGTAHCAYGYGALAGMFPDVDEYSPTLYATNALRLSAHQWYYCFGTGGQFEYLDRPYTPADVARHLRETADELEAAAAGDGI